MPEKLQLVDDPVLAGWGIRFIRVNNYLAFYTIDEDKKVVIIVRFLYQKATGTPFFDKDFHSFKEPAFAGSFCSPPDCRQGAWKECGKYEEENAFRYQRLIDCPVLSGGENVITDSSCSTRSGQNGSCGSTGSKVCGVSVLHKP